MKVFKRFLQSIIAASLLASFILAPALPVAAHGDDDGQKQVVGYFIQWGIYGRNYLVKNIVDSGSADKLTVINYAFGNVAPNDSGQVVCKLTDEWADYQKPWEASQSVDGNAITWPSPILGNFQQLKLLKGLYPNIRVVISLGGWTLSKYFSDAALTPESRTAFVQSCVDLFIHGNLPDPGWGGMGGPGAAAGVFDGIDVDWEYPAAEGNPGNIFRPEDTQNFTALMAEFRSQLDAVRPGLLLTAATPAAKDKYSKIELKKVAGYVDFLSVMTYDFHGPWDTTTNFHSNLLASSKDPSSPKYSVNDTVLGYLKARFPAEKLVVGIPFFGHGWEGVTNANKGLYQPVTGPAPATWEAGSEDFEVLQGMIGTNGFVRHWDIRTQSAWLFNGSTFWTYDDPHTIAVKSAYVKLLDLGGFMFWELSGDDAAGTLISAIADGLACHGRHCH
jgi:chitinase